MNFGVRTARVFKLIEHLPRLIYRIQVIERTRKCLGMDARLTAISPEPFGWGIKIQEIKWCGYFVYKRKKICLSLLRGGRLKFTCVQIL